MAKVYPRFLLKEASKKEHASILGVDDEDNIYLGIVSDDDGKVYWFKYGEEHQ